MTPAHDRCFPPVARACAQTLILGSLPGQRSLQMQQYYAHPQNAFWKLMTRIFEAGSSLAYSERLEILTANKIALWDVLAAAERPGSLDSSIVRTTARANDFEKFFREHAQIRRVIFNGRKACDLYRRLVLPDLSAESARMALECLPSTSPAHAGMPFAEKLVRWKTIKERIP